jgi:crotonobetainyl-CoA:carnitine CoA-transferase CaiB-like acyl-CoA transferase
MTKGPLSHLRVIDLTHYIAGPYCTKLMAGFGAEVIKIERIKTGDRMREIGPFFNNEPNPEKSIPFLVLNTGKKSITLNLKKDRGISILRRLVEDADVVIENFSPRVLPALGLDYDALRQINPRLVMTSISNFGQHGPYRDYQAEEIEMYAMSGLMYETGDPERPPLAAGPAVTQYSAGVSAYIATLVALFQRQTVGSGQHVDISIQEAAMNNIEVSLVESLHLDQVRKRKNDQHIMVPWELYECADGEIALIGGPVRHWLKGARLFGEPEIVSEKYRHILGRIENRREFESLLGKCVSQQTKQALFQAGQDRKLAFGVLSSLEEVAESPQHNHRQFFVNIDHPAVGIQPYCNAPFKMPASPWKTIRAPLLGEHNLEIYRDTVNLTDAEIKQLKDEEVI